MKQEKLELSYLIFESIDELTEDDQWLLNEARKLTSHAYAPYSDFHVGASARLSNGKIVSGSNQENASFPAGLCAERVLLASAGTLYPGIAVEAMAISYHNKNGTNNKPLTPCGICRQYIQEFEDRHQHPIRLILGGMEGKVYVFEKAGMLLPLAFRGADLK